MLPKVRPGVNAAGATGPLQGLQWLQMNHGWWIGSVQGVLPQKCLFSHCQESKAATVCFSPCLVRQVWATVLRGACGFVCCVVLVDCAPLLVVGCSAI